MNDDKKIAECVFCKIIKGDIPTSILYSDDDCIVIEDINPMARQHFLLITKNHYNDLNNIISKDVTTLTNIMARIKHITSVIGMTDYTILSNNGINAGQQVPHLHFHLMCK